jgi:hypothetical protein
MRGPDGHVLDVSALAEQEGVHAMEDHERRPKKRRCVTQLLRQRETTGSCNDFISHPQQGDAEAVHVQAHPTASFGDRFTLAAKVRLSLLQRGAHLAVPRLLASADPSFVSPSICMRSLVQMPSAFALNNFDSQRLLSTNESFAFSTRKSSALRPTPHQ